MDGWILIAGMGFVAWLLGRRRNATDAKQPVTPRQFEQPSYHRPSERAAPPTRTTKVPLARSTGPAQANKLSVRWFAAGQPVKVGELTISGGLIYFGTPGRQRDLQRSSAHIIDPSLAARGGADRDGSSMPYWPHYAEITPAARLAQLQWQAGGRREARFGVGHVFLFFYGLEHRFFIDQACDDHEVILREVTELLSAYGEDHSFHGYATTFLAAARLWSGIVPAQPAIDAVQISYTGLTPDFRVGLARHLSAGPLSGEWLLAWYLAQPEKSLRTPATRCLTEFKRLFIARFNAAYPNGLNVRKSSRRLNLEYRSASGAFTVNLSDRFPDLIDPDGSTGPLKIAADIAADCTEALDGYSRHIGRNPQSAGRCYFRKNSGVQCRSIQTFSG